ncbi:AKAP8 protein, partial [Copsychus sechellarum]|nr:AKAP8 protein [Copsychus sechellarum]
GYEGYEFYTPPSSAPTPPGASYGYGGGAAPGGSWEPAKAAELGLGSSEGSSGSGAAFGSPGSSSDSIIAKINQRLDLLAKEGTAGDGRQEQDSSFRFDSFSALDSRSPRDPFRAAFPAGSERERERNPPFAARDPARPRGSLGLLRATSGAAS